MCGVVKTPPATVYHSVPDVGGCNCLIKGNTAALNAVGNLAEMASGGSTFHKRIIQGKNEYL